MSDIPSFPYELLWHERQLRSVANLTRADGLELLPLAAELGIRTRTIAFALDKPTTPSQPSDRATAVPRSWSSTT